MAKDFYARFLGRERWDFVLDCDTYNEVDDQFAIAYAVLSGRLGIKGFTIAPFRKLKRAKTLEEGIEKSYEETARILSLCRAEELCGKIYRGATHFLSDENTPSESEAAEFLIEASRGHSAENPLCIGATGAATNLASALLMDPTLARRVLIVWLGGASFGWHENHEYNMHQDVAAARVLIGSDVPFVQIPAWGVVSDLLTTRPELECWLKGKNPLADYLFDLCVEYVESSSPYGAWSKVIWDIAVPAFFFNEGERFMCGRLERRRLPAYGEKRYEEPLGRDMLYVYAVKRDAIMTDLFRILGSIS